MWQEYINAASLSEVLEYLHIHRQKARLISGGTDLLLEIERGVHPEIETLIDITRIPGLNKIILDNENNIHIGPLVTHNDCICSGLAIHCAFPLAMACLEIGSPQIRNRGTIAGNIITASPANDTIAPLQALGAKVVLESLNSKRVVPLSEFYTGVRKTVIHPDELMTDIFFPALGPDQKGTYIKLALRRAQAISIMNTAAIVTFRQGRIISAEITLGAVAPTIIHAKECELFLEGKILNNTVIDSASDLAANEAKPISDIRSSEAYRKHIIKTIVKRALLEIAEGSETADFPVNPVLLRTNPIQNQAAGTSIHNVTNPILNTINGKKYEFFQGYNKSLLHLLREGAKLTGTKEGCGEGECGACTVILDGKAVMSCLVPAAHTHGSEILTIEGLSENGNLHPIQQSFINSGAVQCGYCTPGFIMSASILLKEHHDPSKDQIVQALTGNLCRCTGYYKIIKAVEQAARDR